MKAEQGRQRKMREAKQNKSNSNAFYFNPSLKIKSTYSTQPMNK